MRNRHFQRLRTAVLAVACIATLGTPAWAGQSSCRQISCALQGIDRCGCLTNTGDQCCTLCCLINTKTCTFTALCFGWVNNCCRKSECYKNICFWIDPCCRCKCSLYSCDPCGFCCYTASGSCNTQD